MVKISELKIGQVFNNEFDSLTRDLLKQYAKASGDTNPIHVNDAVAEAAGLKGVIAHGLFSFGFISKLFEDLLEHGKYGNIIEFVVEMRGMVRVGDKLVTEAVIEKIEGKRVFLKVTQTSFTNVEIKDTNGNIVKQFEAGERGYVSEKDVERGLVKTKEVAEGTLTYRERIAIPGNAIIELFE
ncbi:MAG: MaoC family dehydratase [Promethearchaeota archaeon]|jgi:acyl dehydratase